MLSTTGFESGRGHFLSYAFRGSRLAGFRRPSRTRVRTSNSLHRTPFFDETTVTLSSKIATKLQQGQQIVVCGARNTHILFDAIVGKPLGEPWFQEQEPYPTGVKGKW
jgi:hypothetical protein